VQSKTRPTSSLREAHTTEQVTKPWVGSEIVNPQISFEKVGYIRGPFLVGLFKKFECLVLVPKSSVYRANHVRRNIVGLGLLQRLTKYVFHIGPFPLSCACVRQSNCGIPVTLR
jgi:hypothetical protein